MEFELLAEINTAKSLFDHAGEYVLISEQRAIIDSPANRSVDLQFSLPLVEEKLVKKRMGKNAISKLGHDKYDLYLSSVKAPFLECRFVVSVKVEFLKKNVK